jgi:hypothetical protein
MTKLEAEQDEVIRNLAVLLRRFIRATRLNGPLGNTSSILALRAQTVDYLKRTGLEGSILREPDND